MSERQEPDDANSFYRATAELAQQSRKDSLALYTLITHSLAKATPNERFGALRALYPSGLPTDGYREKPRGEFDLGD